MHTYREDLVHIFTLTRLSIRASPKVQPVERSDSTAPTATWGIIKSGLRDTGRDGMAVGNVVFYGAPDFAVGFLSAREDDFLGEEAVGGSGEDCGCDDGEGEDIRRTYIFEKWRLENGIRCQQEAQL
jgi:hypothetical protein